MKKLILFTFAILPFISLWYKIDINDSRTDTTFKKVIVSYQYTNDIEKSMYMMYKCKQSKNAKWCFELITSTGRHETKFWKASSKNTFWMLWYGGNFKNEVNLFVKRFNKYWHNQDCSSMVTESRYTLTQKQARIKNCQWMKNNLSFK